MFVVVVIADICYQSTGRESQRRQYECISRVENVASFATIESSFALGRNAGILSVTSTKTNRTTIL